MNASAVRCEVIYARLVGVVQEMQNALFRTGYSTIIRESQDASCAITDREGRLVAEYTVLPLHLGGFSACVQAVLADYPPAQILEGDAFIVNHPYLGGSPHANDLAVVVPVFYRGDLVAFCGSIAHKTDIGGAVPGSASGQATEAFHEGLHLPPVRYMNRGQLNRDIQAIIRANSRTPDLVAGDISGQVGCAYLGARRLQALLGRYGRDTVLGAVADLCALTEARVRQAVAAWPDGTWEGEAYLDNDGVHLDQPVRVHVVVTVAGDRIRFDFTRSACQTRGPCNIRPPLVRAICYYVLKCLIDPRLPSNDGLARATETLFRPGTVVDPEWPAPVNTYMPTAQAVTEAIFQALGQALPEKRIAGSGGTGAIAIGWQSPDGCELVQYELFGSGLGARAWKDGVSATTVHVGNSRITPVEVIEAEFPVRVRRFELIPDSGGAGEHRGGLGFVREYEIRAPARLSLRLDRHMVAPPGVAGGKSGRPGAAILNPGTPREKVLPAKVGDVALAPGDVLCIERPGGGGFGAPCRRLPERVLADVAEGYVTPSSAERDYGVKMTAPGAG